MLRTAARLLFVAAVVVAARPYGDFLISPPEGSSTRWAVTVIALGIAAALGTFLFWKKTADSSEN
jgi:hypothetical protein